MLLGQQVDGVWHTSIVVHNTEWFFGCGVHKTVPGESPFGAPLRKMHLGDTEVPRELVRDTVHDLATTRFRPQDYQLLHNNCNHFSNALANVLCGASVPEDILNQHEVLLQSPMGAMLMPIIMQMENQLGAATAEGFDGNADAAQGAGGAEAGAAAPASAGPAAPASQQQQQGRGPSLPPKN